MNKVIIALAALCTILSIAACDDDLGQTGQSILPDGDGISVRHQRFDVTTSTGYRDSIYVRTGYPLLGNVTDPEYGKLEAGYLAQFYVGSDFGWNAYNAGDSVIFDLLRTSAPAALGYDWDDYHYRAWDSLVTNQLDSVTLRIYYQTYYGDSLAPVELSVYALHPDVDFDALDAVDFYSDNDFARFYDTGDLLGRKAYTSANRELSDSVRSLSSYMPYIEVKLTDELKERFYRAGIEAQVARDESNPHRGECRDAFADMETFRRELLSGVCIRPTWGDGSLIKVYYTAIYFFYRSYHRYDVDGTLLRNDDDSADSTYMTNHVKYIAVTPDVLQMSGYAMADSRRSERLADATTTYITSPQGYYTRVELPVGRIVAAMQDDPLRQPGDSSYFLNGANFYLQGYKPTGYMQSTTPPRTVLMVRESEMNDFFEDGSLPDSKTSCYAAYVADSVSQDIYYYNFGNINSVILGLAEDAGWDKAAGSTIDPDLTVPMAVIPIDLTTNSTYGTILSASNYILPSAIRLKRGASAQSLQVIYSVEGTQHD